MLQCGDAFLDGDDVEEDYHLHIVATKPSVDGYVVVVSISTIYRFADRTVVLSAGDHPWLRHESFVAYNFATLKKVPDIEARLLQRPSMRKDRCTEGLLKRVQLGVIESEQTENGVKNFCREIYPQGYPPLPSIL